MSNVAETSLEAYASIQSELGTRQAEVLKIIQDQGPISTHSIVSHMPDGITINSITPRVLELRKKGFVARSGYEIGLSGRRAALWAEKKVE